MNTDKLKKAEEMFFNHYPGGFSHPELVGLGKKHKMDQMIGLAQENFKKTRFSDQASIAEQMIKLISRSSMVSMFEKPKFRDTVKATVSEDLTLLCNGLKKFLHGSQKNGFNDQLDFLKQHKLAKWSLITIIPNYFKPMDEVFVKPTTAKGVIEFFELEDLVYKAQPSWEFYQRYREAFLKMRSMVDPSLAPNNAAFGGFLMMSMKS